MEKASEDNRYHYNPALRELAKSNRANLNKSETVFWKRMLAGEIAHGFSFNRQRPVLQYIADFMCRELLLIFEVDGISHEFSEVAEKDVKRQRHLEQVGFEVHRFSSHDVLYRTKDVVDIVHSIVKRRSEELGVTPHLRKRSRKR